MQGLPKDHLDALADVPHSLKDFACHNGELSGAQWAMMPKEVQLISLTIDELNTAALDHLSEARWLYVRRVTKEAVVHLPSKVPHLLTLLTEQFPRDMVMSLSCMPHLEELMIYDGKESAINLIEGFPALQHFQFIGKCKDFTAPGLHVVDATSIDWT